MRFLSILLCIIIIAFTTVFVNSQDKDNDIKLTSEQWHQLYDQYAVMTIKLMVRYDKDTAQIDSLQTYLTQLDSIYNAYQDEILSIVGITKSELSDYRNKFTLTESKINNRTGSPADAKSSYFDEISKGKVICLPEFSDRFAEMKKKLMDWEGVKEEYIAEKEITKENEVRKEIVIPKGSYLVVKGDDLGIISELKYGSRKYWRLIWEANKDKIVNSGEFDYPSYQSISNPDLIYPGQILKIPEIKK